MAILSKGLKPDNFEPHNTLNLALQVFEAFFRILLIVNLSLNPTLLTFLALHETNLDDSVDIWSNGLVVKALILNPEIPCSKPWGGSKVDSAFHPSEVNKVRTRKLWELSGKT